MPLTLKVSNLIAVSFSSAGGLHLGRLLRLLFIVRRPRRFARSWRLLADGQLEQRFEAEAALVEARAWISDAAEALGHRRHGEVRRVDLGHLVPAQRGG